MAIVDIVILSIVSLSILIGVFRGLFKEILSISTWVLSLVFAFQFYADVAVHLSTLIDNLQIRQVAAFFLLLILGLLILGIAAYFLRKLFAAINLSSTDRALGAVFGLARGLVIVGLIVFMIGQTNLSDTPGWRDAVLVGHVETCIEWASKYAPQT